MFIGRTDAEAETPILWPPDAHNFSLEKTLMLRKIDSKRRRGQQRMRWLDSITNSMDNEFEQTLGHFGEASGTPLQYSCLANPMDGGAWWAAVHGVATSRKRLSN